MNYKKFLVTRSSTTNRIKVRLLSLIGCVLLLALSAIGVYTNDIVSANRAVLWPTSEGIVTWSGAVRGCSNHADFWPKVRYQYSVERQVYIGEHLIFGNVGCGPKADADAIAHQFPIDANITVHFSPENPGESVLLVGKVVDDTWSGIYFFTSVFIVFALFGLIVARK